MQDELNKKIEALEPGETVTRKNIPDDIYHRSPGIGSTAMREAVKSMAHYKLYCESEREPTPDMITGSAIHTMVLEPDLFFDRFVMQPKDLKPGNNNAWKNWKAAQTLPILTEAKMTEVKAISESVMEHAFPYFSGGVAEVSYWHRDKDSGLILKARIDYQTGDLGVDLKSTKADSPKKFANAVKYDYAIQDALYRRVTGLADLMFIGASKEPPYCIYAARQSAALREQASADINQAIKAILIAQEFDEWPLPPIEIVETE